jgi:hypothetical protein
VSVEGDAQRGQIVDVHAVEPVGGRPRGLAGDAEMRGALRRQEELAPRQVPVEDRVARAGDGERRALLALAHRFLGLQLRGLIAHQNRDRGELAVAPQARGADPVAGQGPAVLRRAGESLRDRIAFAEPGLPALGHGILLRRREQ